MNIGKKIKKIRLSKGMTQSELAGNRITRNMLSQIENGSATPSLSTIVYISQKLDMPAGYFLAESENDFMYGKMLCIDMVKKAYADKNYKECIEICKENLHEFDDEIYMILCESYFHLGQESFKKAHLSSAHKDFNTALQYAEKTVYNVDWIRVASFVHLEFIGNLLPSLKFEPQIALYDNMSSLTSTDMYNYLRAKELIDEDRIDEVRAIITRNDFSNSVFAAHIRAKLEMKNHNYAAAVNIMKEAIESNGCNELGRAILYSIYTDMEICCREGKDFEHAYEYATKKSEIIPEMGK